MKTPDEIKKDALALIRQTDASYRQLSKVLCDKENATLEEVLQAVSQVKAELAAVKRERDALLEYLTNSVSLHCDICKHESDDGAICCQRLRDLKEKCFEWRGVYPENTEVQEGDRPQDCSHA